MNPTAGSAKPTAGSATPLLHCTECPRLASFLADIRSKHPDYHARPVLPFGDPQARLLIALMEEGAAARVDALLRARRELAREERWWL
mgnify:CR=1 FL=1